ncbi:DUF5305 domain-containing protein [Halobaculum sp. EA56]|uniref:DUF5305 domain-containing protein n=1 Tax=Halobaculum sp. EA56 TaxID=3421648 RepID=UPI003EB98A92
MADRGLRARALLDTQFETIVILLVVLALVGGWLTFGAHVSPGTTTEQRTVSSWSINASYDHSATVTENSSLYPVGRTLSNRSLYFQQITPVLNGTFRFRYLASDSGSLDLAITRQVVVRSVTERDDRTVEVWRRTRDLPPEAAESLRPNETVTAPFTVDVNGTINETEQIDEQLDNPPGDPRMSVVTTVRYSGSVNGRSVEGTEEYVLGISFENGVYVVNGTAGGKQFETTRTVEVPREPDALSAAGGPTLFGAAFVGLAALVLARARNDIALTEAERERLAFEDDRETFDEWINAIDLPPEARDLPRASAHSLGDLVDFAIDTDSSVVENPEDEVYYVVHDGYCYVYEAPNPGAGGDGISPSEESEDGDGSAPGPLPGETNESGEEATGGGEADGTESTEAEE